MEIIINNNVQKSQIRQTSLAHVAQTTFYQKDKPIGKCGTLVEKSKDFQYYHRNYLDYLMICWENHWGAVVSPTILWNIVLNEIASEINKNSDKYRFLFSMAESGKQIVTIAQYEQYKLNVEKMCSALKNFIPTDIGKFMPKFSTDTEMSNFAMQTTFLDAVQSYYEYRYTRCAIPKIKICGTYEDYHLFNLYLIEIYKLFLQHNPDFSLYILRVIERIENITQHIIDVFDNDFLTKIYKEMFSIEKCGSGHPDKLQGWILDFFVDNSSKSLAQFPSLISSIEYKDITDLENPLCYRMFTGLLGCEEDGDYLIPDFGYIVYKV